MALQNCNPSESFIRGFVSIGIFETSGVCVFHVLSISKTEMPFDAYSEKESSLGFGRDDGASLAGKESAIVLSSIFSRFAFELSGSTTRSSGSLPGFFEGSFSDAAFLRTMVPHSCAGAS
jgi:hypothetical protein